MITPGYWRSLVARLTEKGPAGWTTDGQGRFTLDLPVRVTVETIPLYEGVRTTRLSLEAAGLASVVVGDEKSVPELLALFALLGKQAGGES